MRRIVCAISPILLALAALGAGDTTFHPDIPKVWDDRAVETMEVPLAQRDRSPRYMTSVEYYALKVRPIYRSVRKERQTIARDVDSSDLQPASVERGPYAQAEHQDLRAQLRQALETLPITLRTAVVLRDLQELSYQEIADRLGLPEGTVKSRINRGRIELAHQLKRVQENQPVRPRRRGARSH